MVAVICGCQLNLCVELLSWYNWMMSTSDQSVVQRWDVRKDCFGFGAAKFESFAGRAAE